jgi:hypothetical protein
MAGSTPIYGFPYPESSDLVANYPALGQDLAEDVEAAIAAVPPGGLILLEHAALTGSAVSIDNVFTSDYRAYRVIAYIEGTSVNALAQWRVRASGSDLTSSVYLRQGISGSSTSVSAFTATTGAPDFGTSANNTQCVLQLDFIDIAAPRITWATGFESATTRLGVDRWYINNTNAYDGITISTNTGTMSGGFISIYGYLE